MIDLSKLVVETKKKETNPREIFMALPTKEKKYSYLRDVQSEVLKKWIENKNLKNNIIKMNTGSGKTVVALLILLSSLNENIGSAVYVVPDSYLVNQVCDEANKLGIPVTTEEESYDFRSKKAILVINIHKLVNGKSVFGMRREGNINIGSIVIDDVHACMDTIQQQFTITIPVTSIYYQEIINILKDSIKAYSKEVYFQLIESPSRYSDFVVPFWIWQAYSQSVKRLLASGRNKEIDFIDFNFPLLEDMFDICNCSISYEKIEISSKCVPFHKIKSFDEAKRRIFLSATLSDDSVFPLILGLKQEEMTSVITPENANDIGDRLMLFPEYLNPKLTTNDIKLKIAELSQTLNVVIIVPSFERAKYWENISDQILSSREKNIETGIMNLKNNHIGVTIIINKYDGIDLPDEACRILVIDGLPNSRSIYEGYLQSLNPSDKSLIREKIQKIEQGIGRGVRSNTDYCVVVFMGKSLTNAIITCDGINYFSDATKNQYELSSQLWELLVKSKDDIGINDIFSLVELSINRNVEWIKKSKEALNDLKYNDQLNIDSISNAIRNAFDSAYIRDYSKAFSILENEKNIQRDIMSKGFLMQLMAEYKNFINKVEAQELLKSAEQYNRQLLKPIDGIKYDKTINSYGQSEGIMSYLHLNRMDQRYYLLNTQYICEDLCFRQNSYRRFEEALKNIFSALGFVSSRPENEYGFGPDNLVALGNMHYLVIECKNESSSDEISKSDINQINGSIQWFNNEYKGKGFNNTPLLIHNSNTCTRESSPHQDQRIMTPDLLDKFREKINEFCIAWLNSENPNSTKVLDSLLHNFSLTPDQIINQFTSKVIKKK